MIKKLVELTYGEARYEVLKELDTKGPIGKFLIKRHPNLISDMELICRTLEKAMTPGSSPRELGNFPENVRENLRELMMKMPTYLILESDMDWTIFLSGLCLLITNYIGAEKMFYESYDIKSPEFERDLAFIAFVEEQLMAISHLAEIGSSFLDLVIIANRTTEMLKDLNAAQPGSLKLSQMYLKSLGIKGGTD